ncbi:hypothetical protein CDD82_2853 [Ophiocordyceps australis]|uniref:Glutathione synthetase n=1 Tax=Ophiocordyceps australis TaxID=1399860 RepID=A0A2C5ZTQ1_9HYPO|nr:hypothetical protein CDD82_2853 [Ophiocordyceps australis]
MAEAYPPPLGQNELDALVQTTQDWSLANGLSVRHPRSTASDEHAICVIAAPVTLFPSPFPRSCFEQAQSVQRAYNELYAAVSCDQDFIAETVKQVETGDDFIRNLWQIHVKVKHEGYTQPLSLGLFRSDYMVHRDGSTEPPSLQVKQVEFNTIASSFGGLSHHTSRLHKFLATTEYPLLQRPIPQDSLSLPENNSIHGLAAGIQAAYHAYRYPELQHPRCVIFLVQAGERNVYDQRHLEYQLAQAHPPIPVFRLAFTDILTHTFLANSPKRQLLYRLPSNPANVFEVAVVYMRAGYGPGDYADERSWDARYHIERSAAIKCPTVLTQLAGTKKVQQVLATPRAASEPSILGRFINDDTESAAALRKTFTNIYPMDASAIGIEARSKALDPTSCQAYVLKPQREGGGNNKYRGAIPDFLHSVPEEHWGSYILMELITPPPLSNLILRNGNVEQGGVICELGVYGACLWNHETGEVEYNKEAGYLLRTKGDTSEEGGVAAGFGCMDSCVLVHDAK